MGVAQDIMTERPPAPYGSEKAFYETIAALIDGTMTHENLLLALNSIRTDGMWTLAQRNAWIDDLIGVWAEVNNVPFSR